MPIRPPSTEQSAHGCAADFGYAQATDIQQGEQPTAARRLQSLAVCADGHGLDGGLYYVPMFHGKKPADARWCQLALAPTQRQRIASEVPRLDQPGELRVSEAVALRNMDIDLERGMLTIHRTKFGKSRQVPMHHSSVEALRRYRSMRDLSSEPAHDEAAFFVGTRGQRRGLPLSTDQVRHVFAGLREQLGWCNRGVHHAPRIHDLRHTMVVRRVMLWHTQGVDIDQAMLALSTYVGHVNVTNTYWYLSAVPELIALAAQRFESSMHRLEAPDA